MVLALEAHQLKLVLYQVIVVLLGLEDNLTETYAFPLSLVGDPLL